MCDFNNMSDAEIATFIETNINEFGDYEITASEILAKSPAFVKFEHGFAVVLNPLTSDVELWFLYVAKKHRGQRLGRRYVRHVLSEFAGEYYMTLHCHKRLRPFYGRLGFRVIEREGDSRKMQG